MDALQKIKLSKELLATTASLNGGQLKALEKIKASKRALELVALLGGGSAKQDITTGKDFTPLLNSIINGDVSVFDDGTKLTELVEAAQELGGDDMPDENKGLFIEATKAAGVQMLEGKGFPLAA